MAKYVKSLGEQYERELAHDTRCAKVSKVLHAAVVVEVCICFLVCGFGCASRFHICENAYYCCILSKAYYINI